MRAGMSLAAPGVGSDGRSSAPSPASVQRARGFKPFSSISWRIWRIEREVGDDLFPLLFFVGSDARLAVPTSRGPRTASPPVEGLLTDAEPAGQTSVKLSRRLDLWQGVDDLSLLGCGAIVCVSLSGPCRPARKSTDSFRFHVFAGTDLGVWVTAARSKVPKT